MATLKEAGQLIAEQLRERVDRLVSAVEDDAPDFEQIVRFADDFPNLRVQGLASWPIRVLLNMCEQLPMTKEDCGIGRIDGPAIGIPAQHDQML